MSADGAVTTATGALASVAQIKDLASFVVLAIILMAAVGLAGWVVWKGVPALVGFLGSQEKAMNAIVLTLTELRAEVRAEAAATRAHVTAEMTDGARHPIKGAIEDVERDSIVRDAATITKIGEAQTAIEKLIRDEHKETREQLLRELARSH